MGQNLGDLVPYKYVQFVLCVFPCVDSGRVCVYTHTWYCLYHVCSACVMLIPSNTHVKYGFDPGTV